MPIIVLIQGLHFVLAEYSHSDLNVKVVDSQSGRSLNDNASAEGTSATRIFRAWGLPVTAILIGTGLLVTLILPWTSAYVFPDRKLIRVGDNVYYMAEHEWKRAVNGPLEEYSIAESERLQLIEKEAQQSVTETFSVARENVEAVSDWYFSTPTQLARGVGGVFPGSEERTVNAIMERLFPSNDEFSPQALSFVDLQAKSDQLAHKNLSIARELIMSNLEGYAVDSEEVTQVEVSVQPEWDFQELVELAIEKDALAQQLFYGALASTAGAGGAILISRTASRTSRSAAARGLTRFVPGICLGTGPLAPACGVGLAVGSLLATEAAILHYDRAQNREPFEEKLYEFIDSQETRLREEIPGRFQVESEAANFVLREQLSPFEQIRRRDS